MLLPNLIIGGAPKCGTSSVYNWLVAHPDVCGSKIKETFYLMDTDNPLLAPEINYHQQGLAGYQYYFQDCGSRAKFRVEATTHYLYQQTALEVLASLQPLPRIIFMLRKPSLRVYSSYQFTRHNLARLDRGVSFKQLIDLIQNQSLEDLEKYCHPRSAYVLKRDIAYSCYINYLEKWREKFDSDYLQIYLLEDLQQNPFKFMESLAVKLGLDPQFYRSYDFNAKNQTFGVKNTQVHRQARSLAGLVPKGKVKEWLKNFYLFWQADKQPQQLSQEDQETLTALEAYFAPFNQKLATEFNLDLSLWQVKHR